MRGNVYEKGDSLYFSDNNKEYIVKNAWKQNDGVYHLMHGWYTYPNPLSIDVKYNIDIKDDKYCVIVDYMTREEEIKSLIRNIPDFPIKGIIFRDITSVLNAKYGVRLLKDEMEESVQNVQFNKIVAIESRGFILGSLLAAKTLKPLVLARKTGKLPGQVIEKKYNKEYGKDSLCIQVSDIKMGDNVLVIDDLIALGNTSRAVCDMVTELGANISACYFLIELNELGGRKLLEDSGIKVISSVHY